VRREQRETALKSLISSEASATLIDSSGRSPLLWAASLNNISAVKFFASKGAVVSLGDLTLALEHHMLSPMANEIFIHDLIIALAHTSDTETSTRIFELGVQRGWEHVAVNAMTIFGPLNAKSTATAVHYTAKHGRYDIMDRLVAKYLETLGPHDDKLEARISIAMESNSSEAVQHTIQQPGLTAYDLLGPDGSFPALRITYKLGNVKAAQEMIRLLLRLSGHEILDNDADECRASRPRTDDDSKHPRAIFQRHHILTIIFRSPTKSEELKLEMLTFFEEQGIDLKTYSEDNNSPPILLTKHWTEPPYSPQLKVAEHLIQNGCDLDARDASDIPLQFEAGWAGSFALRDASALHLSAFIGNFAMVELLIRLGVPVNAFASLYFSSYDTMLHHLFVKVQDESPLMTAIRSKHPGRAQMIDLFLRNGADPAFADNRMQTTLQDLATQVGFRPLMRSTCAHPRSHTGYEELDHRVFRCHCEVIKPNPLAVACLVGDVPTVQRLANALDGNFAISPNVGAFHLAVIADNVQLVEFLISYARVDATDCQASTARNPIRRRMVVVDSFTPLCLAAMGGSTDIAKILLATDAWRVDLHDNGRLHTELDFAASFGHLGVIEVLLANGAVWTQHTLAASKNDSVRALLTAEQQRREKLRTMTSIPMIIAHQEPPLVSVRSGSTHQRPYTLELPTTKVRHDAASSRRKIRSLGLKLGGLFKREARISSPPRPPILSQEEPPLSRSSSLDCEATDTDDDVDSLRVELRVEDNHDDATRIFSVPSLGIILPEDSWRDEVNELQRERESMLQRGILNADGDLPTAPAGPVFLMVGGENTPPIVAKASEGSRGDTSGYDGSGWGDDDDYY